MSLSLSQGRDSLSDHVCRGIFVIKICKRHRNKGGVGIPVYFLPDVPDLGWAPDTYSDKPIRAAKHFQVSVQYPVRPFALHIVSSPQLLGTLSSVCFPIPRNPYRGRGLTTLLTRRAVQCLPLALYMLI